MRALFIFLLASPASADVLQHLSGDWGLTYLQGFTCAENPTHIAVQGDRLTFSTPHPAPDYTGVPILSFGGTILSHDAQTLVMRRDDETRLDAKGAPILWRLHLYPDGFCWERMDQPRPLCPTEWHRCGGAPAS